MFNDKHGISIYIDKLSKIDNKNIDLKKLKHCRYLRNKIVHEPNCTEENMCKPEDVKFLNDFYKKKLRIMQILYLSTTRINLISY